MGNRIACLCDRNLIITPRMGTDVETEGKNPKMLEYVIKLRAIQRAVKKFLSLKSLVNMRRAEFDTYIPMIGRCATQLDIEARSTRSTTYGNEIRPLSKKAMTNVFWKDPVLLNEEDAIYHGNWSTDFKRKGYGCLFINFGVKIEGDWDDNQAVGRIYYPFGFMFDGSIVKVNNKYFPEKGVLHYPDGKVLRCLFERQRGKMDVLYRATNANNPGSYIIVYHDYSIYDGHITTVGNLRNGFGKVYFINGSLYEGEWKNDTPHGNGMLFIPIQPAEQLEKIIINEIEHKSGIKYLGYGDYTKGTWVSGHLNGKGVRFVGSEMINCTWRHGKVIESKTHRIEKSYQLHPNILRFLNLNELTVISKIKNKVINNHLNNDILKQIVIKKFFDGNKYITEHFDSIANLSDLLGGKNNFIPLFGYYTNGGYVFKKFHYSNIFNPNEKELAYTNFVQGKVNNVTVKAAFKQDLVRLNNTDPSNYRRLLFTLIGRKPINITVDIEKLKSNSHKYIDKYNIKDYSMNFHTTDINDRYILPVDDGKVLFSLNYMLVDNSYKIGQMKYLLNPLKWFAVFVANNPDDEVNDGSLTDEANVEGKSIDELKGLLGTKNRVINTNKTNDYDLIEFDSQMSNGCRLVALVELKTNKQHVIALTPNYHIGKYVTLKLINQTALKGFKKTSIDIGTINFYGDFFNITN
jgi:hypothetical protein